MSGKYDPPDKARLVAANPSISSTCELMVAAAEAKFTPKAKGMIAHRARARGVPENPTANT